MQKSELCLSFYFLGIISVNMCINKGSTGTLVFQFCTLILTLTFLLFSISSYQYPSFSRFHISTLSYSPAGNLIKSQIFKVSVYLMLPVPSWRAKMIQCLRQLMVIYLPSITSPMGDAQKACLSAEQPNVNIARLIQVMQRAGLEGATGNHNDTKRLLLQFTN